MNNSMIHGNAVVREDVWASLYIYIITLFNKNMFSRNHVIQIDFGLLVLHGDNDIAFLQ